MGSSQHPRLTSWEGSGPHGGSQDRAKFRPKQIPDPPQASSGALHPLTPFPSLAAFTSSGQVVPVAWPPLSGLPHPSTDQILLC